MPPRGKQDLSCINCSRKGHTAAECRQPKVEKADRKCFTCRKTGHESRACPEKSAQRLVRQIDHAAPVPRKIAAFCISTAPDAEGFRPVQHGRRMCGQELSDFIAPPLKKGNSGAGSRFRPLTLDDWKTLASTTSSSPVGCPPAADETGVSKLVVPDDVSSMDNEFPDLAGGVMQQIAKDRREIVQTSLASFAAKRDIKPGHVPIKANRSQCTP